VVVCNVSGGDSVGWRSLLRSYSEPITSSEPAASARLAEVTSSMPECRSPGRYDDRGWRATFYTTGVEHSPTSAIGTAWERAPWHATQRAAWEALKAM
jgi:hypothetical protein